jgi:hypothetical protein
MSKARPDFITIQLSEAGRRMAGEAGTVGWANGRRHFHFKAGEAQEIERSYEWNHLLRHERFEGEAILEEVLEDVEATANAVSEDVQPRGGSRQRGVKDGE